MKGGIIETAARWLESSMQLHAVKDAKFWFRDPAQHIIELLIFNVFLFILYAIYAKYYECDNRPIIVTARSTKEKVMGYSCMAIVIIQVVIKFSKSTKDLAWMSMPCHVLTVLMGYVLVRGDSKISRRLLNISLGLCWGPLIAMLMPDFDDHVFAIEPLLYVVQHTLLIYLPFYLCRHPTRYVILHYNLSSNLELVFFGSVCFLDFHMLLSYWSGYNINYGMYPPPLPYGLLQQNTFYRFYIATICIIISVAVRYMFHLIAYPKTQHEGHRNSLISFSDSKTLKVD